MNQNCPICSRQASLIPERNGNYCVDCKTCGQFIITKRALFSIEEATEGSNEKKAILGHATRKRQRGDSPPLVSAENLKSLLSDPLPSVSEQVDNLLIGLAQHLGELGRKVKIDPSEYIAIAGAKSDWAVRELIDYLVESGFLKIPNESSQYVITVKGWQHYEGLQKQSKDSTKAFMAMKFGESELDKIVDGIFRPAVLETGFRLQKLNDEQSAGLIDDQLRVQIRRSRFLIADLTHGNKGAYWEAGFAEGIGIPVIYTCKESAFREQSHFDTNHHLTVMWHPDKPEEAAEKLKATIRATLPEVAKMED